MAVPSNTAFYLSLSLYPTPPQYGWRTLHHFWPRQQLLHQVFVATAVALAVQPQAIATGAQTVAVACPFCSVMMSDAVAARQQNGEAEGVEVTDIARLMLQAARGS